jgi:periplasmic protein TonB
VAGRGYAFRRRRSPAPSLFDRAPGLFLTMLPYLAVGLATVAMQGTRPSEPVNSSRQAPLVITLRQFVPQPAEQDQPSSEATGPKIPPPRVSRDAPRPPLTRPGRDGASPPAVAAASAPTASPSEAEPPQQHAPPAATGSQADELLAYRTAISARLAAHRPRGIAIAGRTLVEFQIDRSGRLVNRRIASSSSSALLDRLALKLVRDASPYPAPPAGIPTDGLRFILPIDFS